MEVLLKRITAVGARLVIIDLTGVDTLDADAADCLLRIVHATRLSGAESVISGISPMLASMLAGTDARINTIQAYLTLEAALHDALDSVGQAHKDQP